MPVKPLLALALMLVVARPAVAAACPQPVAPAQTARLQGLDAAGDLRLADGRTLRLTGLAPRQDEAEEARFRAVLEPFFGNDVGLLITGAQDRWGRWPARVTLSPQPDDAGGRDLATLLRQSGAAKPMPEAGSTGCAGNPDRAAAGQARPATTDAVNGHDLAVLKRQEGRYVIVEGRIASVGERAQRTYLNFSRRPKEAAAIVLSRKLWRELQAAGWTAATLTGKRLRAHGVLGGRDGLLLDVTERAALELID